MSAWFIEGTANRIITQSMSKKINIATIYYVYWLYIKFDYITVLRWLKCNLSERQSCVFFYSFDTMEGRHSDQQEKKFMSRYFVCWRGSKK